jgi:hypothetical protein
MVLTAMVAAGGAAATAGVVAVMAIPMAGAIDDLKQLFAIAKGVLRSAFLEQIILKPPVDELSFVLKPFASDRDYPFEYGERGQ